MPTLMLMCGLPGAGKTTLARQLEVTRRAVRLCPDEWIDPLLLQPIDAHELARLRAPIEAIQWELTVRLLALGQNVILEWGFWPREERELYRARAQALGAQVEIYVLLAPIDTLWERLDRRNRQLSPGTFFISKTQLELWWPLFEPPEPSDQVITIVPPSEVGDI